MNELPETPRAPLVRRAQDLPVLLSNLQTEVDKLWGVLPLIPDNDVENLKLTIQDSLSDANTLVDLVTVQQQLTGADPLDPAAKTGFSPLTDEEYDDFDETTHSVSEEPLSEDAKQQLLSVFAVYDSLNSKQVNGVAHAVGCSSQQVRSFFSDMRTRLRNISTAAIKKANKLNAAGPPQHVSAAAAGPGAGNYGQPRQLQQQHTAGLHSQLHPYQQQASYQHQQWRPLEEQIHPPSGSLTSMPSAEAPSDPQAAAAAALGPVCSGIAAAVSAQRDKLSKIVDAHNGGAITSGGRFLGALSSINTWAGRTAALAALQASYNSNSNNTHDNINSSRSSDRVGASAAVKGQLGSSRLLDVLEGWMNEAVKDKQTTFIVQALKVLSVIHLSTALLQGSSITHIVEDLQHHKQQQVAAAAQRVMQAWAAATGRKAVSGGSRHQQQQQHYAAPGGLIALGGQKQVTAGYKRKINIAVRKRVAEMELAGDLKRTNNTAAAAAAVKALPVAAAVSGGGGGTAPASHSGLDQTAAAAATSPSAVPGTADRITSSKLKPPSRRVQLAGAAVATGPASGAAAGSSQPTDAARRLAALHNLNRGGQQRQQQQRSPGVHQLPPERRLFVMTPHGRAAAAYLAAAGPWGAEVTNATQVYDKAVQRWLSHRPGAAAREQETAAAAMHIIAQQQQQKQHHSCSSVGSSGDDWMTPPVVPQGALATVGAGEESQVAKDPASQSWLEQWQLWRQQQQQAGEEQQHPPQEPDDSPAVVSTTAAAGGVAPVQQIPWHPVNEQRNLKQRCWLWAHGVRLPMHIIKPPSAAEYNRHKQEYEKKQARKRQQQTVEQHQHQPLGQPDYQAPPPGVPQYIQQPHHLHQQQQPQSHLVRPHHQQQVPLGYQPPVYHQQQHQQQEPSGPILVVGQPQQQQQYVVQQPQQQQQPVIIVVPAGQAPPGAVLPPGVQHHGVPVMMPQQQRMMHIPQQQQQQQTILVPQQQEVIPVHHQQPPAQEGYFPQGY